jgi:hypothetical protein
MRLGRTREGLDDLQRGQALWQAVPQSLRGWIQTSVVSVVVAVGAYAQGRVSQLEGWQLYVLSVGVGCMVFIAYGVVRHWRLDHRQGHQSSEAAPSEHQQTSSTAADPIPHPSPTVEHVRVEDNVGVELKTVTRLGPEILGVEWWPHSLGLALRLINLGPEALREVSVTVTNILWWHEPSQRYTTTGQFHQTGDFVERVLGRRLTVFADQPAVCGFLTAATNSQKGHLEGTIKGGSSGSHEIARNGRYKAHFHITDGQGRIRDEKLCFQFDTDKAPEPCLCDPVIPKPHSSGSVNEDKARPRLTLRQPGAVHIVKDIAFYNSETRQVVWRVDSLRMRFVNEPKQHGKDARATNVGARIAFSRDGVLIREIDARWTESDQPTERLKKNQSITDFLRVDFDILEEREIDIAVKAPNDQLAYIFNNDSYLYEARKPDFALEPGIYQVRVRLAGVGVDERFNFSFINPGAGKRIDTL